VQIFGGSWTEQKIEMVVGYAKAYLTIMNKFPQLRRFILMALLDRVISTGKTKQILKPLKGPQLEFWKLVSLNRLTYIILLRRTSTTKWN